MKGMPFVVIAGAVAFCACGGGSGPTDRGITDALDGDDAPADAGADTGTDAGTDPGVDAPVDAYEYLRWHFAAGATVVVMNVGATGDLGSYLQNAVYGPAAIAAYQRFLAGQ